MNPDNVVEIASDAISAVFPKSFVEVSYGALSRQDKNYIIASFALAKDSSEATNNIMQNDPALTRFSIELRGEEAVIERFQGSGFSVKPSPGSFYAMETHKVPFRKSRAKTEKKVGEVFKKYFTKLKGELQKVGYDSLASTENLPKDKF